MFKMTKNMAAVFIAIMMLAQLGLAQHSAVHFNAHGHYEQTQDNDDSDQNKRVGENCKICLLTKSLSVGLTASQAELPVPSGQVQADFAYNNSTIAQSRAASYNPRAPPAFLI